MQRKLVPFFVVHKRDGSFCVHSHAIGHPLYNNMPLFRNNPMLLGNKGMLSYYRGSFRNLHLTHECCFRFLYRVVADDVGGVFPHGIVGDDMQGALSGIFLGVLGKGLLKLRH